MPDELKGEVEAVVARVGIVDRDGDILERTAIEQGAPVVISDYGHSALLAARLPVGVGRLSVDDAGAVLLRGRYFLDLPHALAAFRTLRRLADAGLGSEWSIGFLVRAAREPTDEERRQGARRVLTRVDVAEASPVLRGAGIGTRTVEARHRRELEARHRQEVVREVARFLATSRRVLHREEERELRRFLDICRARAA